MFVASPPAIVKFLNRLQRMKNTLRKADLYILEKRGALTTHIFFDLSELLLTCTFGTFSGPVGCG